MNGLKKKPLKEFLAIVLALAMIFTGMQVPFVSANGMLAKQQEQSEYGGVLSQKGEMPNIVEGAASGSAVILDTIKNFAPFVMENAMILDTTADLTAFAAGAKADGDSEKAGTNDYFTLLYSEKTKVDASKKSFEDGYEATQRVNFGGIASIEKNAIKFTITGKATVKVYWAAGDVERQIVILDSTGTEVIATNETLEKNVACISTLEVEEAGTYYLGSKVGNNYIFRVLIEEEPTETVSELDTTADLAAFAAGAKADGDSEKAGTNDYFTLLYSEKTKVDASKKSFEDGYEATQRVNFGGIASIEKNAIKFTITGKATVKVYWAAGDVERQIVILDSTGTEVIATNETLEKNVACISTLEVEEAGTYYLGSKIGNNYIFRVIVTEGGSGEKPPRAEWSSVEKPEIINVAVNASDKTKVDVTVQAVVGYDGADKITVTMYDADGKELNSVNSSAEKTEHVVSFVPSTSGKFTFSVKAIRENEEDKISEKVGEIQFLLPLTIPYVSSATNKGNGSIELEWNEVLEAESYIVTVNGEEYNTTDQLSLLITGLTVGSTYTFGVCAVRGTDRTEPGEIKATVTQQAQRKWAFSAYGSGADTKNNGYEGSVNDGSVTVYSESGKGKLVPGSTDGLAFYYTTIDPETENFTLKATVSVDSWTLSNGQEGFGLMVADAVGPNGNNNAFWNNSFMAVSSKIEYNFDGENVTADTSASKISMKLGLGTIAKTGVTAEEVAIFQETGKFSNGEMIPEAFVTESSTLETSCGPKGSGTYNIVGNFTGAEPTGTQEGALTTFHLSIQRNNTGYILSYLNEEGEVIYKKLYYDLEKTALTSIDKEHIYLGFFASRNARITVTDVELTTIHPEEDAPAEDREIEKIYPNFVIESASVANQTDYDMVYYGNADGTLKITGSDGSTVADQEVKANTKYHFAVKLKTGNNRFTVTMTPDPNYVPGEYKELTSYDTVTFTHNVSYNGKSVNPLYVAPNGEASGKGTKSSPVDIYTAVQMASPGTIIVLAGGTYHLNKMVKVERGMNGTESQKIYMIADPNGKQRPVFDFGGNCAGMTLAGDYWYFYGFDVTNSADAQKGIQVSGDYNTLDQVNAYKNGNTGIQISRYLGTDEFEDWPSYNLILNCTSYLNADKGYEDADGFAAKLTVGDGNVFDGCIAAYNADDGWDFFAKVQSGEIGSVTIKNSVAFKNGYVIDESGKEVSAGNGNGFKMGGDSMSGYHVLENSVAFANKAKGIDSNSCPDIQVYHSTSFDNESYNVAMYTNAAVNTDFLADGILSYKKSNHVAEQFKLLGTQDNNKVYKTTNYFFDGTSSVNTNGEAVTDAWFVDLDTEKAITNITRDANGLIQMNGYLELTGAVPSNVGAKIAGTASLDAAKLLASVKPENSGNNSSSSSRDDDDDDDDDPVESFYIGKNGLNSTEQSKVESAASSIFGSSSIESVSRTENGICIISKSKDVIFSKNNGELAINEWQKVGTDWYYFDADRKAAAGWKQLGGKWYYLEDDSKKMVTGWKKTATGKWYYLDQVNGDMKTDWQQINQVWYYLDHTNGDMKVDWQWINNKWYYLDPVNGNMKTGWQLIRGKWYYMNKINGDCLLNTVTPDGYTVDKNGVWIP